VVIPERGNDSQKTGANLEEDLVRAQAEVKKLSRRLEAEVAERRRMEKALRALPTQIISAQDTERRRIARELHDGVNQLLASTKFRLMHLESELLPHAPEQAEAVTKVRKVLEGALVEVRRISNNLRPTELDDFGLVAAVQRLSQELEKRSRIVVQLDRTMPAKRFPKDVELAFYRIAQEALANIEEHAKAHQVIISLIGDADFATLNIRDDGRGFADPKTNARDRGHGIVSMRERANALGGVFSIKSKPGRGTEISVHVKLAK
jgi:two-component system NarL family sensor kinase